MALALLSQVAQHHAAASAPGVQGVEQAGVGAQVVSGSRPGRTGQVRIGQPWGAVMTSTLAPWWSLPDHHRPTLAARGAVGQTRLDQRPPRIVEVTTLLLAPASPPPAHRSLNHGQ